MQATATLGWQGGTVDEEVVRLGERGLVGILTRPSGHSRGTVVWLNSGSEPHVGPGRAWVEYARELALFGFSSLRIDFSGWGESPDRGHAPGRPYDQHGVGRWGGRGRAPGHAGHRHIVLAGLCAGAWIALRAALTVEVDGVVAINPQMYWQPGDPVEADIVNETRVRRLPEIRRNKRLRSVGLWSALDALGARHPAAVWLRALECRQCRSSPCSPRATTVWSSSRTVPAGLATSPARRTDRVSHRGRHRPPDAPALASDDHGAADRVWLDGTLPGDGA